MRAVFDPNVLISAALSRSGRSAELIRRWEAGSFELVISRDLIAELRRALSYPKLVRLIPAAEAQELIDLLEREAEVALDPAEPPQVRSADPGDDYLIALSVVSGAALVSGDAHLLAVSKELPIYRPADFLALLGS